MMNSSDTNIRLSEEKTGHPVVLQVVPSLVTGGVERGAIDIAGAVAAAGGTAVVASEGGAMVHELSRAGARHVTLPLASKNPWVIRRNIGRLVAVIEDCDVDIVHARSRAPAWSAFAAAGRTGRHFVTTFHGTYGIGNALKRRYNAVMTKSERVIAVSEFIARHIRENYAVDPRRIRVIQRGVDIARFDPDRVSAARVVDLARRWRLPDGVPVVMLPGRLTRWKGQTVLIEAMARLADLELCCLLVGSDQGRSAYRSELEELIDKRGLESRVFIVNGCEDMPAAYKLCDVVVSASTDPEAFGRVISEAQAMGLPVVASNHGGAPEQVVPNRTGLLVPPGDAEALAHAVRDALALTGDEREALATEAIDHVRANFSKDLMCSRTLAVYNELVRADAYAEVDAGGEREALRSAHP